jgi:hypothetical protein
VEGGEMTTDKKLREGIGKILDNLLADWADGKVDNPDKAIQVIFSLFRSHYAEELEEMLNGIIQKSKEKLSDYREQKIINEIVEEYKSRIAERRGK